METKVGVETKFVEGAELGRNEVSRAVYENFLPNALAGGAYIAAPEPQVVGHGLDHIQEALDTPKQGVNTKKIVVSL
ncbi:Zinc-binding oxidoreductase [Penicillium sp. IBT 31633x]|nr:Zinc-binding oxidoreductase [Penicillium sp. IBT 31633x]